MGNQFFRVKDTTSLEALMERSQANPVVIFKHSTTCPISASAYREMEQVDSEVNLIEVQSARSVSEELEKRLGIRHESPQVIVLRQGKVVWDASHWKIKAGAVADAVRENA
jgi:bacillithiol system protein YtxJ